MASHGGTPRDNVYYKTYGAVAPSSGQGGMKEHTSRSLEEVQSQDLKSGCLIGKGTSSVVYETTLKGKSYARKDFLRVPGYIFKREAAALVRLNHPNVLRTYCWTVDEGSCSLVVELMDSDLLNLMRKMKDSRRKQSSDSASASQKTHLISLEEFLKDRKNASADTVSEIAVAAPLVYPFDLPEALKIMVQVAQGVKYLHDVGVAHGDLKPKNILVALKETVSSSFLDENMTSKVADFGLFWTKLKSRTLISRRASNLEKARWRAPELLEQTGLRDDEHGPEHGSSTDSDWDSDSSNETIDDLPQGLIFEDLERADVYNFALTCAQILTGEDPYPELSLNDLVRGILGGLRPELPPTCPAQLRSLLERCWGEKTYRPSFEGICSELKKLTDSYKRTTLLKQGSWMSGIATFMSGFKHKLMCKGDILYPTTFYVDERNRIPPELKTLRRFSSFDIMRMTNDFNEENVLHQAYGRTVYKGTQGSPSTIVTIVDFEGAFEVFKVELELMSRLNEKQFLVAMVGYCLEPNPILIYEYPGSGSLFDHLHGTAVRDSTLEWRRRLHIALNVAQGLEYLHTGSNPSIIHRNVNSNNILLTPQLDAKVASFGLAKFMSETQDRSIMGTIGYLDPEYIATQCVSTKSDVYSFGIVLLELITGSLPIDQSMLTKGKHPHIVHWVRKRLQDNDIDSILAPIVKASNPNMEVVWKVAQIAMRSVEPKSVDRPRMAKVVEELKGALTIEVEPIAL